MVECYGKGVKYSLIAANTIIFLTGAVVLSLGIWTVSDRSFMERLLGMNLYIASAVLLIITGTVVAVIAMLGSLGAYKEVKSMLKVYFVILLALLAIVATTGIMCFIFRGDLEHVLQRELHKSMKLYGNDSHATEAWDSMHINFACCGVASSNSTGWEAWRRESPRFNTTEGPLIPESCCRSREDDAVRRACQSRQPRKENFYIDSCYDKMKSAIKEHMLTIGLIASTALLIIIFGLILSGSLYLVIRRKTDKTLNGDLSSVAS